MRTLTLIAALIATGLSGCTATTGGLTTMTWGGESQLRNQTVYATGIPAERLVISRTDEVGVSQNGYFASDSQTGERWSCTRNAGVIYMGLANAPTCTKL